jgi:hypothetical protein
MVLKTVHTNPVLLNPTFTSFLKGVKIPAQRGFVLSGVYTVPIE